MPPKITPPAIAIQKTSRSPTPMYPKTFFNLPS
jgi:hypothetical protein